MSAAALAPLSSRSTASPDEGGFSESFTTVAPLGYAGGDANLYRYCGNGPANTTDPTGEATPLLAQQRGESLADVPVSFGGLAVPPLVLPAIGEPPFITPPGPPPQPNATSPEAERQQMLTIAQWMKDNGRIRKSSAPDCMCEEQAVDLLKAMQPYHFKYWRLDLYNRRRWTCNPAHFDGRCSFHEVWNLVKVTSNKRTNPFGQAWFMSPFWGYDNKNSAVDPIEASQFFSDFPLVGDYPYPWE